MINAAGGVESYARQPTTTSLGITTLQMGVFGGIGRSGVRLRCTTNCKIRAAASAGSFGAAHFVPIVSSIVYLVVGHCHVLYLAGGAERYCRAGTGAGFRLRRHLFIYGLLERALIPFDRIMCSICRLWQTRWGGNRTAIIDL